MPRSPLTPFYDYWVSQSFEDYPGLLTLPVENRFKHPRAYVTSVIDAVWSFYEAFFQILVNQVRGLLCQLPTYQLLVCRRRV